MIATKTMLQTSKLKIKFGCKRIEADPAKRVEADPQKRSGEFGHQVPGSEASLIEKSSLSSTGKRGPSGVLENSKEKKLKMDRTVKVQCSTILKTLITHKDGWPFREPVDPVKLHIPDYFSVILHPMDLGTIKSRLDKNMYFGTEEFAADVRLTFSNAMLYNPPSNYFHQMAKNLNKIFETKWGLLDGKLKHGSSKVEPGKFSGGQIKKETDRRHNPCKTSPLDNMSLTGRPIPCEEKVRLPIGLSDHEVGHSKPAQNCTLKLFSKSSNRGTDSGNRQASGSTNAKQPAKCGSCGNMACRCRFRSDSTHPLSGISCERSIGRDHVLPSPSASRLDCQAKSLPTSQTNKSDLESDGALSALSDENICPSPRLTTPVTDAASGDGWTTSLVDVPLSPKRALRAAFLKSRFADTIWKAQQGKLLDHGDIKDPLKMRQEREKLERRQREEKARIEAELRAAEAATQIELQQQRERKREEARIALEKIKRTVEIEPNTKVLDEIERLTGFSPCTPLPNCNGWSAVFGGSHIRSPLEQLGLFIKAEFSVEEDDESVLNEEGEEGEIF